MPGHNPYEVGITGGIGSGKSVVARIFQLLGVPVYESDAETKLLYFVPEIKNKVISLLGEKAYSSHNAIDSQWIAAQIYAKPELRKALNEILHPEVGRHYRKWVAKQAHPYVLKVAALLFEARINETLDLTLLVVSPIDLRKKRIKKRDPFRSEEQIKGIIASQFSEEDKINLANGLIFNDEKQSLIRQVYEWDQKIRRTISP